MPDIPIKSLGLKVKICVIPFASIAAIIRTSWVRLPVTLFVVTKSSQFGKICGDSLNNGKRSRSWFIMLLVCSTVQPRPLTWVGLVATTQNSIITWVATKHSSDCISIREIASVASWFCTSEGLQSRTTTLVSSKYRVILRKYCRD